MDRSRVVILELDRLSSLPWAGQENALGLLQVFQQFKEWGLALQRYGTSERRTFPLEGNLEKFIATWERYQWCVFKSRKPWNMTVVVTMYPPGKMYPTGESRVSVHIADKFFDSEARTEAFVRLATTIYLWGHMDYGNISNWAEEEEKNVYMVGPHTIYGGGRLDQMLPGIYWANFFGPRYVKWFGMEKFETLPAFHKKRLPDGGWLVLTRPTPKHPRNNTVRELEQAIIKHLGEAAFFDKENPNKPTVAPPFAQQKVHD